MAFLVADGGGYSSCSSGRCAIVDLVAKVKQTMAEMVRVLALLTAVLFSVRPLVSNCCLLGLTFGTQLRKL
jgi:hypothetical protein